MYFIICFVFIGALAYKQPAFIRKHSLKLYGFAAAVALVDMAFQLYLISHKIRLDGMTKTAEALISRGVLATAIIAVVMYTGALGNKNPLNPKLRSVRAELSIIACFLMLPHNGVYAYYSLNNLLKVLGTPSSAFKTVSISISLLGLISFAVMIPLFITSFRFVRKKMRGKTWKKLQSWAYVFYGALYLQIMLVHLGYPNRRNYWEAAAYSAVFLSYGFLRIRIAYQAKARSNSPKTTPSILDQVG